MIRIDSKQTKLVLFGHGLKHRAFALQALSFCRFNRYRSVNGTSLEDVFRKKCFL